MADEARLLELAEEALNSDLTPAQVCAQCPELTAAVQARLSWYRGVDLMLEDLFPSTSTGEVELAEPVADGRLPVIPGYEVVEVLGRGSAGVIYRVRHLKLNRAVALKMLLSGEYASPAELKRFRREARAVAALDHPNIVHIYDVSELDGRPYFTMELVEGGTLSLRLGGVPQGAENAAALLKTLARAVHVAHEAGIVHRDLKPGNILLMPDGTPKISDFGLASRFAEEPALTFHGTRLGTPNYMSPEQAAGESATSAAVDIYSLGAMLYEMLTGKPPFHGATAAETHRMVISDEPVRPSRLYPKVPRDLETICLKCLNKNPAARYASAAALADDLDRLLRLEPIEARATGAVERMVKWTRRQPSLAAAIAVSVLFMVVAASASLWYRAQAKQFHKTVEANLAEVIDLEKAGRWSAAATALHQIGTQVTARGDRDLQRRIEVASWNLALITDLDAIRLSRATAGTLPFYRIRADDNYAAAFRQFGLDPSRSATEAAARIDASPVRGSLIAALDDWAVCASDANRRIWILDAARQSDSDRWRNRIRDPKMWDDPKTRGEIARDAPVNAASVSTLIALAERLRSAHQNSTALLLLQRIQQGHPGDFWANLALGQALYWGKPDQAEIYFRAALAARPEAPVGFCCVGDALARQEEYDAAIQQYAKALDLDPKYARARCNLAEVLKNIGKFQESITACEQTLQLDPNYAWGHFIKGGALRGLGKPEEAVKQYALIYAVAPDAQTVQDEYRGTLIQLGRGEDARAIWKQSLGVQSAGFAQWTGYPELSLFLGKPEEYRWAKSAMLKRFRSVRDLRVAELLARTCLLVPLSPQDNDELDFACDVADRALKAKTRVTGWQYEHFQFLKGLADYRSGPSHYPDAIASLTGLRAMGPCPKLVMAMAEEEKGDDVDARRLLTEAIVNFDWRPNKTDSRDLWIYHILRREAQARVLPNFPALLTRSTQPSDTAERITLAAECQFQRQDLRCADLFRDALAAEPDLMVRRNVSPGFVEACAACALSSHDPGTAPSDAPLPSDQPQRQAMALHWLNDQLAVQMSYPQPKGSDARAWLRRELILWGQDPALPGVRNPNAIASLAPQQRKEWTTFWNALDDAIAALQDDSSPARH